MLSKTQNPMVTLKKTYFAVRTQKFRFFGLNNNANDTLLFRNNVDSWCLTEETQIDSKTWHQKKRPEVIFRNVKNVKQDFSKNLTLFQQELVREL